MTCPILGEGGEVNDLSHPGWRGRGCPPPAWTGPSPPCTGPPPPMNMWPIPWCIWCHLPPPVGQTDACGNEEINVLLSWVIKHAVIHRFHRTTELTLALRGTWRPWLSAVRCRSHGSTSLPVRWHHHSSSRVHPLKYVESIIAFLHWI